MTELFLIFITFLSFVYFLTIHALESVLNKIQTKTAKNSIPNFISVVVCARNEEKNLPGLFSRLEQQITDNLDVEFIIVNDRSKDKTADLIEQQVKKDSRFKTVHINDRQTGFAPKKRAIDKAIKIAKGDLILLTDADGRPQKSWIQCMVNYFNNGADMVIGYAPYSVSSNDGIIKKMLALEYFSIAVIAAATSQLGYPITCVGTNMAYRKKVYQATDGFGKFKAFISGDDDLFLTLVRENGNYNIVYAADSFCHVYNAPPKTWSQFVNQRLRYASKGFNYPWKVTLSLALYVIYNIILFSGFIIGLFYNWTFLIVFILIVFVKAFFEYKFLRKAGKVLNDSRFINYYFLTAVLHIPYVIFFGIFSQFKFFKWTEKKVQYGVLNKAGHS